MSKITCQICGELMHAAQVHLKDAHPDWTIDRYKDEFPDAPLLSARAEEALRARMATAAARKDEGDTGTVVSLAKRGIATKKAMHELFGFGAVKGALNARGEPIMITVTGSTEFDDMIPNADPNYVYDLDLTKDVLMALEARMALYLWGYHGTGKTSIARNVVALTNRPWVRAQHTINTEESHIVGQMMARDGSTYFEPGPLALAMKHGWAYCADEYDFAMPAVLAVYQPVLEGEPLYIKEAPPEWRHVVPHKDFRFIATGNTNGCGDETGLYQGTQLGNAANYSRFGVTKEVGYMAPPIEAAIVAAQTGVDMKDANRIVEFANEVRKAFANARIGATVSPRELINAAKIGLMKGSNWRAGLNLAFTNRLSRIDKEIAEGYAQRVFG